MQDTRIVEHGHLARRKHAMNSVLRVPYTNHQISVCGIKVVKDVRFHVGQVGDMCIENKALKVAICSLTDDRHGASWGTMVSDATGELVNSIWWPLAGVTAAMFALMYALNVVGDSLRDRLFSAEFRRELQGYHAMEVFRAHAENAQTDEPLSLVQYLDLKTYLPGDILTKVDRASMAHYLEVRVPLLDHELVEWAARLPPSLKLRRREGKYILKRALESRLPHDVLYRPKMGFAVPLARWFRGPLAERVRKGVLESHLADSGIFDMGSLRRMVDAHGSGVNDYSGPLWSLLMFEAFLRKLDGQVQQAA